MRRISRRRFFKETLAAAATVTIAGTKSSGQVLGANNVIRIAVAGTGRQGFHHVKRYLELKKDVKITYLIDPDPHQYAPSLKSIAAAGVGTAPKTVKDFREALKDKELDAVSIVTPNHWHSLLTIEACKAKKDVYVEKPCSHNFYEGKAAVEAAKANGCVVQHGTQSRGMTDWAQTVELIKSGQLGQLSVARGLCYKNRESIGFKKSLPPPEGMDFDLWLGPAPKQEHHANLVHYNWHWFWDFGNGEIGNQGVHQMDVARWGIPGAVWPKSIMSVGGRYGVTDQGQTPNTQIAVFDYGQTQLIFEVRGLKSEAFQGEAVGNVFHLAGGTITGKVKCKFYPKGKDKPEALPPVKANVERGGDGSIFANFIAAIRTKNTRTPTELFAPLIEGHYSSTLCHLANISYRLGQDAAFNGQPFHNAEANATYARMCDHLKANGIDLAKEKLHVGKLLVIDDKAPMLVKDADAAKLMTRDYRKPYVV